MSGDIKERNCAVDDCQKRLLLARIEALEAQVERLKTPAKECYHEEGCQHWVEVVVKNDALRAQLAEADATIDAFGKVTPQQYQKELAEAVAHGKCGWEKAAALKAQLAAAREALERIASIEPVQGKASKNRGAMVHMQSIALAALGKDTQ